MKTKAGMLRKLLESPGMIVAPGGFSPIAGIIAEKIGFKCMYMSGYGVSAFKLGYPDIGLMTMNESLDNARNMARAIDIPLIADCDTGYGNVLNMKRTVEEAELSGLAGIQIEDQVWPKRCGHMEGKQLISVDEMVNRIRIACDSRNDEDFVIVARTDANTVLGFEEAVNRLKKYREAGADVLFFESPTTEEQVEMIPELFDAPVMINMSEGAKTPIKTNKELEKLGYKLAIWPSSATWAAAKAIDTVFSELMEKGTTQGVLDKMYLFDEFNEMIGLQKAMDLAEKYK